MCNEKVDNYPHSLQVVPERYKAQNMFGKTVITYSSTMKFVPKYFMTHKMCYKAANRFFFYLILFLINVKHNECVTEFFLKILF